MKKIIAFGASNSKNSINKKFATATAHLFPDSVVQVLDLNDFEVPTYGIDIENEDGIPKAAHDFFNELKTADLLVVSMAEHNGNYTAAFKSIFDWMTRIDIGVFHGKPMLLLSTSPGKRGAATVLEISKNRFPEHKAKIYATYSLPNFKENFDEEKGIINLEIKEELLQIVDAIELQLL